MSTENVQKFFELAKSNEKLSKKISKIKDEIYSKGETIDYEQVIIKKVVPLAKKFGLDFNLEDFLSYTNTLAQQRGLSDGDLLNVSGGMSGKQGLAMLGIMLTLTPTVSGFMVGSAVDGIGEQQDPSKPTSSYSMNVDNDIDTSSTNNQGAKNAYSSMTGAGDAYTSSTTSDDEDNVAGKFNENIKTDVEKDSENSKSVKSSSDLGTFNTSENKQNAFETAENKEETQAEAKVNADIEKKADDTETNDDSLKDIKSDVSTEDTASATTAKSDAEKPAELSSAAGSATKMAKAEAAAEEATKSEAEAESNIDKVSSTDGSASETNESSKTKEKYFYSAIQFSSWKDNGDGTVTAVDEDGETHTFSRHNEIKDDSTQKEQLANLANTVANLKENSLNSLWPEDRVNFGEDLGNFIRKCWNAKTGEFEVDGVSNDDPNLQTVASYCKDPKTNTELKVGFTDSNNLANTINRINSIEDLATDDLGQIPFMKAIKKVVCSKKFNTPNGTLKESLYGASQEDIDSFKVVEDFYNNKISNYDKSVQYFKLNLKKSETENDEESSNIKKIMNWVETGNKLLSINELKSNNKADFVGDAKDISKLVKCNYKNNSGDKILYYTISGVSQNLVNNFVKIWDALGLSKNVEYSSTNSNNPKELRDNLEKTVEEADYNILNVQKESREQFIKDLQKLSDLENQNDNEEETGEGLDSDEVTTPKEKDKSLNQTSERELLNQVKMATDETEKNNAIIKFLREKKKRNNASKVQGDQNAALSEAEEEQNSQNEARNQVDSSDAATEKTQGDQNVMSREAEEVQSSQNESQGSNTEIGNSQSNKKKVDFTPLKSFGSTVKSIMPTWLGGRAIEEQQLDHLLNFIEETKISGCEQVSASTRGSYLAAINEIGQRIAVSRNETEKREKIYYFNGEVQDSSHSAAFATILRDFENLSNNN